MPKLLFFSGSSRQDSINQKMAATAAKIAADQGAEVTLITLKDFEMPLYDGDFEADHGLPENALRLKKLFIEHDGFFIASPEYNSAYSAVLKNAIDWISRTHEENEPFLSAFRGKVAALGAMSPGPMAGLRGLTPLRMLLGNISVHVVPSQTALQAKPDTFNAQGHINDDKALGMLGGTISELIETASALKS